jgi:hypothetical protein
MKRSNYTPEAICECGKKGMHVTNLTKDGRQRLHCFHCGGSWMRVQRDRVVTIERTGVMQQTPEDSRGEEAG